MNINTTRTSRNFIETILVVCLLLALLVAMYTVLHLFFDVLTFAIVFAISFERFFEWIAKKVKSKRKIAAMLYCVLLITVVAVPIGLLFSSLTQNAKPVLAWIKDAKENGLPALPASVASIPLAGKEIAKLWNTYHDDPKQIVDDHHDQVKQISNQAMASSVGLLSAIMNIIIGIIISAILLVNKESTSSAIQLPLQHLLGKEAAVSLLDAIAMSIRGVSIGVMGTALIAAALSFIGLEIAGVHFSVGLSAIVFFLVVIQIGPLPLWIPLVLWMSTQNRPGMVVFLIIWGIMIVLVDYVVKPILIGRSGGRLPFLVLFLGVVGGLAAWGFTGMFKGAIILAVFYTIYQSWLGKKEVVNVEKS